MRPLLFQIGPFPIRSYGLMIVIGFLCGIWLATHRAKKEGIDKEIIMDLSFYLLLSALIGSKLLHVIIFWQDYYEQFPSLIAHPAAIFEFLGSGLVFFGGLLAAVPTGIYYLKKHHLPIWQMADIFAPAIPLAHGFGRIGCFLAGCCYGKACDLPWAVEFHNHDSLAILDVPLHPTQLYSSLFNFSLCILLIILSPYLKKYGQLFGTYMLIYPLGRSFIEFFRADARGSLFGGLVSTSQFISILIFFAAIFFLWWLRKNGTLRVS